MGKPSYFITQQMRLFPPRVSACRCEHCGNMTIHFLSDKNNLTCNECGWYPVATDYMGVEVKIR
jgi:ribosomal protein S27E